MDRSDMNHSNNKPDDAKKRQRKYERYCRQLARANGVPENIVDWLRMADDRYSEIRELFWKVEDEAGVAALKN